MRFTLTMTCSRCFFLAVVLLCSFAAFAQKSVIITGRVTNMQGEAVPFANVYQKGTTQSTTTDLEGNYRLEVIFPDAANQKEVVFQHITFEPKSVFIDRTKGREQVVNINLEAGTFEFEQIEVKDQRSRQTASEFRLDPKSIEKLPSVAGGIEGALKLLPGVQSNNELSSQYSVRGGNYDENLVYVNDFEVYRPMLVSSGQQEGLSFINPALVDNITFSTGGFSAKYGDKLSSVLNIQYKRPKEFKGSVMASMLGVEAHVEGSTKKEAFSYLAGVRYKSNAYLLGTLDTKGEYNPSFLDVQSLLRFRTGKRSELEVLLSHSNNRYNFIPDTRITTTGTINQVLRLTVFFDGSERDYFYNTMGGVAWRIAPNSKLSLKFLGAAWMMREAENSNVIGEYFLDEVEADFSKDEFGNVKQTLGVGTFHDWTRNTLDALVVNGGHKGYWQPNFRNTLEWGVMAQYEDINDKISEWERVDSAGYSLPYTGSTVNLSYRLKSANVLQSVRTHGYLVHTWDIRDDSVQISLSGGVRYHYWNVNREFTVSPRLQFAVKPNTRKDVVFRLATGLYVQPPFYRELRDFDGNINTSVKAQKAVHVIAGSDLYFTGWDRNFKFTSELFYKQLMQLNPYELQDVRIRYFADNNAKGYAAGIDMRLFGELVKGTDSWISLSFLRTQEDLKNDFFKEFYNAAGQVINVYSEDQVAVDSATIFPGYIPRPTDQLVFFGLFFQDYVPKLKRLQMHLNLLFGTGLPYGPPDRERYKDVLRMPWYRRVDIGFSYIFLDGEKELKRPNGFFSHFDKIWISAEVFNLLGVQNTLSYKWVKDVYNIQWPMPDYLTSRRFNLKLHISW